MKLNYKAIFLSIGVGILMVGCVYRPPMHSGGGCQGYYSPNGGCQAHYSQPATISPLVPSPQSNCCQSVYRRGCNASCY